MWSSTVKNCLIQFLTNLQHLHRISMIVPHILSPWLRWSAVRLGPGQAFFGAVGQSLKTDQISLSGLQRYSTASAASKPADIFAVTRCSLLLWLFLFLVMLTWDWKASLTKSSFAKNIESLSLSLSFVIKLYWGLSQPAWGARNIHCKC